jgi:CPA2 family monovalent cation:H+ antiporter-2
MENVILTLGILFFFALIGSVLASKFKQPILLGLLLVGAVIGPYTLGIIKDTNTINMIINIGAILMLFMIGLQFDISKLQKIGLKAIVVGLLKSGITAFIGFIVGLLLGLGVMASLFIGIILAFSSTVVIVKVLEEREMLKRQEVPLLIAVLIIEDILAVTALTFFSGIRDKSTGMIGTIQNLVISMCILMLAYLLFVKLVKPILSWILNTAKGEEVVAFMALAMCAGFSSLAYYLSLSPAAGAFLAGSIVASLSKAKNFENAIAPYNLIVSSLFFLSVGTLVNFASIKMNIMIILVLVLTVILTRMFTFAFIVYMFANFKGDKMFFSSMAMLSVGEFALLVAQEAQNFNIGIDLISISTAIIFITAILMSLTLNHSDKLYEPTKDHIPYGLRKKLDKFSNYIKAISEELDLDNKYSKGLKSNVFRALLGVLIMLLSIFGWRELLPYLNLYQISQAYISLGYFTVLAIISIMLFYIIYKTQKIMKSLSDIFANATNSRSVYHSRIIVKRAFIGFTLFGIALIWPFMMFLFNMPIAAIIISAALLIVAIWQFHKISIAMDDNIELTKENFPTYKKWDYSDQASKTKNVNQGWKL